MKVAPERKVVYPHAQSASRRMTGLIKASTRMLQGELDVSQSVRTEEIERLRKWRESIEDIAMHYISLCFTNARTGKKVPIMEASFGERYATSMCLVHRKGLVMIFLFLLITTSYDYYVLQDTENSNPELNPDNLFRTTMILRYAVAMPTVLVSFFHTYRESYPKTIHVVWICNSILGSFPIIYNVVMHDFGSSWMCLFIMYSYNCTPLKFFHNATFCAAVVVINAIAVLSTQSSVGLDFRWKETLYILMFYILLSIPGQSREFTIRVSYLSELVLLSQHLQLQMEEDRSHNLLHSMLPDRIVDQLKAGEAQIADKFDSVTVLFAEVCNFDTISSTLEPHQVVEMLGIVFSEFDHLVDVHEAYKVETVGAVFMVVCGCPDRVKNHVEIIANLALSMIRAIPGLKKCLRSYSWGEIFDLDVRIGLNSGSIMAGVVGVRNPRFKLFGDTVNVASRMESTTVPGSIQISQHTYELLQDRYVTNFRGTTQVKGKGTLDTYFLVDQKVQTPIVAAPEFIKEKKEEKDENVRDAGNALRVSTVRKKRSESRRRSSQQTRRSSSVSGPSDKRNFMDTIFRFVQKHRDVPDEERLSYNESASRLNTRDLMKWAEDHFTTDIIISLPTCLTAKNVIFGYNFGRSRTRFEYSFREAQRPRWMRFFRRTILFVLILKPLVAMFATLNLSGENRWSVAHLIFVLNFCVVIPIGTVFLLFTFYTPYEKWEQLSSFLMLLILAILLTIESASNSEGHGYLSVLVLYQCHFTLLTFASRCLLGILVLVMYLTTHLTGLVSYFAMGSDSELDFLRVLRNGLYIFVFFAAQAWVVFHSEFEQRVNHHRSMILNAQQVKLADEQKLVSNLLHNLLPPTIVKQLKTAPQETIAESFDSVTVLFTDMVGFTAYSSKITALQLVEFLNNMYTRFDAVTEKRNVYKVEIIGDAYFVVGGCPVVTESHAKDVIAAAFDMLTEVEALRREIKDQNINIRIGIHTGPVVAGVVRTKDPRYHLFGDTVTIAQNLESSSVAGRIHVSESTYRAVKREEAHWLSFEYNNTICCGGENRRLRT